VADKMMSDSDIKAIGVSCGGPLNSKKGIIMSPPNLPGWDNIKIVNILQNRYNVPAYLQNNADACALAEWKFGSGKGYENMAFLTFGTGMGAGLILNGRLYSGGCGMAGEIGHVRLEPDGPIGYGKRGSFEGYCSGNGMQQQAELLRLPYRSAKDIADAADNGDEACKDFYCTVGKNLGRGISILIDVLILM